LKTATNTYRLKAAAAATTGQPAPVRAVFDRIERFRGSRPVGLIRVGVIPVGAIADLVQYF
jgi:hypothetical protein